jgi:nucleotide-binding universal stress UspA family protein
LQFARWLAIRGVAVDAAQLLEPLARLSHAVVDHVMRGVPADSLRELCGHVDLLVIGSGYAGASGRVQLGSTGHRLLADAPAPILIAPRPRHAAAI